MKSANIMDILLKYRMLYFYGNIMLRAPSSLVPRVIQFEKPKELVEILLTCRNRHIVPYMKTFQVLD